MVSVQEKFKVDVDKLRDMQITALKTIKRVGEKHMALYRDTMSAFKFPERRMKCHDTKYYEEVLPIIEDILNNVNDGRRKD